MFSITTIYDITTHTDSYHQVEYHKLSYIKFSNNPPNESTISIVFNKFIATLRDYEYTGWTPEVLYELTCLNLLNYLINPVADLLRNIKSYEIMENKGVGFTTQQVMDVVLEYVKVTVTTQSYEVIHQGDREPFRTKRHQACSSPCCHSSY